MSHNASRIIEEVLALARALLTHCAGDSMMLHKGQFFKA